MKKFSLLLLLVAPLALAACGGGSSSAQPTLNPLAYVKHAASKTVGLSSEHMVMTANIGVSGMEITMNGSGDFSNKTKSGEMSMNMSFMGRDIRMNEVFGAIAGYDGTTAVTSYTRAYGGNGIDLDYAYWTTSRDGHGRKTVTS